MSYKAHEFENHFMIEGPDGASFPMAKEGLSHGVLSKIKSYGAVKMYDGGVVPGIGEPVATPAPQLDADPTAAIPQMSPIQSAIAEKKDYLQKLNPGIYASAPHLLDRDAQDMVLNRTQKDANAKSAEEFFKNQEAAKLAARDQEYNDRASKLGMPLRNISLSGSGQSQMTPAVASADGTMMPEQKSPQTDPQMGALGAYGSMFKQYEQGINNFSKEAQGASGMMGQAYKDQLAQSKSADELHANNLKTIQDENHKLTDAYMTGKVDPNRVWKNMDTGNRVTAAISLALGGIGAGLTGKSNAAMDVINGAIDKDIEAQKADLGKSHSLLQINMQKYGNEQTAYAATKAQIIAATQAKIGIAAASMQNAQGKLAAQQSLMGLQQQRVQLELQMSQMMTKAQLSGLGTGQGGIQTSQLPFNVLSDPKTMERAVDVNGRTYLAKSDKEAETLRNQNARYDAVTAQIQDLNKLGATAAIPGTKANLRAEAIINNLATEIPRMGLSTINESEVHQALLKFRDPRSFSQILNGGVKNEQFMKNILHEVENDRANKLVGYKPLKTVE